MPSDPVMVRFPSQPASVPAARRFVTEVLVEAGASSLLDDARLLISELAANAVLHAGTDFSVTVHLSVQRLYVEVRDGDRRWTCDPSLQAVARPRDGSGAPGSAARRRPRSAHRGEALGGLGSPGRGPWQDRVVLARWLSPAPGV